jgi:tRNA pseudouridine32 synthase/23S rRNA pseudouridine746 synthase
MDKQGYRPKDRCLTTGLKINLPLPAGPAYKQAMLIFKHTVASGEEAPLADFLSSRTGLAKARVKDALNKGAVQVGRPKLKRVRRATLELKAGDRIELHYDEKILAQAAPEPELIAERPQYSVWLKPAGVLSEGTACGDHLAITRLVELKAGKPVYLVHRLDRETAGLMLLAHTPAAAARLSRLFQQHLIEKHYLAEVKGRPEPPAGSIEKPLDGKAACTSYRLLDYDAISAKARLDVTIAGGRLHQIRRHLAAIGCPVIGDPRYGRGNKNASGLRLMAVGLDFTCPFTGEWLEFSLAQTEF